MLRKYDHLRSFKLILLLLISSQLYSQTNGTFEQSEISGKLLNISKEAIVYASVSLFENDSTFVNSAISTPSGGFKILDVPTGIYTIHIDHIEYERGISFRY